VDLQNERCEPLLSKGGFTVFFSGLSGAGKSTIALALQSRLLDTGRCYVKVLDDNMFRFPLSCAGDYSRAFRDLNTLRIAAAAEEITRAGGVAVCAEIAASDRLRERTRKTIEKWGRFFLIYVSTPLAVCEQRDCNGLYRQARAGLLDCLTGITDPYEAPEHPDVTIDTSNISVETAVYSIMQYLRTEMLVL
jgi:sulfate adenylyltransferase